MGKINVLDKDVYNKIAAGEVVEKPASVVKELVENSIDAGATSITIEILEGGINQIKVIDNGCGIEKDDFEKVFLAHATSKVKTINDLSQIGTLGFRGEALSSIASVSKITMSSKTESDIGYQIVVTGGELGEIEPIGATTGTYMVIKDLFYNIPARRKFLRKPKLEENDITNYISRLILANPNISFKYLADNKIVYQSFGTGLYDAIYTIYGKSIVDNIFEVNFERGDFKFSGYLGKPTFSKPNRTYQTLIINGRYVINQSISTAIYKAFENFIMKGNFPFFVLNLNIPLDKVDVNVHPNKLDIKFEDSNQVFGIVYSSVTDILYSLNNTKTINILDEEEKTIDTSKLKNLNTVYGSEYNSVNTKDSITDQNKNFESDEISEVNLSTKDSEDLFYDKYNILSKKESEYEINKDSLNNESQTSGFLVNGTLDLKVASPIQESKKEDASKQVDLFTKDVDVAFNPNFKTIGTLFNTYILIEDGDSLKLVDQHAGHERILFDKFNVELNNKQVALQPLLIPYILEVNYLEANHIKDNIDLLAEIGINCESFGDNSFKVSTVPMLLENINLQKFFDEFLVDIDNNTIFSKNHTIKDYLAKTACKSAIKGNDILSQNEIDYLVNKLNKPGQVLLCPHGRPIVLDIKKSEIEKMFKRIV